MEISVFYLTNSLKTRTSEQNKTIQVRLYLSFDIKDTALTLFLDFAHCSIASAIQIA